MKELYDILSDYVELLTSHHLHSIPQHTCFNRIELPLYKNYADLERFVNDAIHMELTGFGME